MKKFYLSNEKLAMGARNPVFLPVVIGWGELIIQRYYSE